MINKKKNEVNTSGIELAIALIVAPLTPSERFLPIYSDAVMKPSPARQITKQQILIRIRGITIPILDFLVENYLVLLAGGGTKIIILSNSSAFLYQVARN